MLLLTELKGATNKKEISFLLQDKTNDEQYQLLTQVINDLNEEIEMDIAMGSHDLALWKMSATVMFEDIKMIVERSLFTKALMSIDL